MINRRLCGQSAILTSVLSCLVRRVSWWWGEERSGEGESCPLSSGGGRCGESFVQPSSAHSQVASQRVQRRSKEESRLFLLLVGLRSKDGSISIFPPFASLTAHAVAVPPPPPLWRPPPTQVSSSELNRTPSKVKLPVSAPLVACPPKSIFRHTVHTSHSSRLAGS